jgi:Zn-dependent M28 family amino/carboxypeptidase
MAIFGVLLVLTSWASVGCGLTNSSMEPKEVAAAVAPEIDKASVREHLEHLTGASAVSLQGSKKTTISERGSHKGRKAAAEYMKKSFETAGIPARILEFTSSGKRGYNVEATLKGSEGEKHLWVTAHLDSVGNAGANDNASGLTLLLLAASALEELDLEHTVHFVAYDLEEIGIVGSQEYVLDRVDSIRSRAGEEVIIGNINTDMVGYEENDFSAFLGSCGKAGRLDEALMSASRIIDSPVALDKGCLGRSDHVIFWEQLFPAVLVTDDAKYDGYPCYHMPCDTMDELNISYLCSIIRMVTTASALLAVPRQS